MPNTALPSLLTPDTGSSVLRILEQEAGISLPRTGFVAGQAVTSALLQLSNQPGVVYNDIDLFGDVEWSPFDSVKCNTKNLISFHNGSKLSHSMLELRPDPNYDDMVRWTRTSQILKIQDVRRDGDLNYVWFQSSQVKTLHNRLVLNTFDINSVQVGVDLATGELSWTPLFDEWTRNRQVRINFIHASVQTLSRVIDKATQKGNYAFLEFELARCFSRYLSDFAAQGDIEADCIPRNGKSLILKKLNALRLDGTVDRKKLSEEHNSLAYLEGWLEVLQLIVPVLPTDEIVTKGIPVIGQKYFEKMSGQPLMMEHFTFIKVNSHYLVVPKKLPSLMRNNPAVFATHVSARARSFYGSDDAKLSVLNLVNPEFPKADKAVIYNVYSDLHSVHRDWLQFKAHADNRDRRELPPAEWFVGIKDEPQDKYLTNYEHHRTELEFFVKAKSIREFNSWCKRMYVNVEKVFAKDNHLFYGTFRSLAQAVKGALRAGRVSDTSDFSATTIATALTYFENPLTLLEAAFVEFSLNATLERDQRSKERDLLELVRPVTIEDYPLQALDELGVVVTELVTGSALKEEGLRMKHCVGGYSSSVSKGYCRIFSLRLKDDSQARSTLELRVHRTADPVRVKCVEAGNETGHTNEVAREELTIKVSIGQNRAKSNLKADDLLLEAGKLLESHFNTNNRLLKYETAIMSEEPLPKASLLWLPEHDMDVVF